MDSLPERLAPPNWMTAPPTRSVLQALSAGGAVVRFVGGCVRDALLGLRPDDVDIATPETPDQVIRRLEKAKLKAVPTGIDHGTVTAVLPPATFQITTLRRDVVTDGRHAVVCFGTDWAEDAKRRDFTINALYADPDGRLHDFTNGRADLAAGIVRFIGDPAQRVAEDYLRVLRFFRFHARFGKGAPHDASLRACAAAADRLDRLSGERVRDELLKILALPNATEALALMERTGVLRALLPQARFDFERFGRLTNLQVLLTEQIGLEPEVWPRLAILFLDDASEEKGALVAERLKLSNAQRLRVEGLLAPRLFPREALLDRAAFGQALYRHGVERCRDHALLAAVDDPDLKSAMLERAKDSAAWQRPVFPLRGADVLALGFAPGPTVSALLNELEKWWADNGFMPDREACLTRLRERVRTSSQP
ncbi:CCA tRNA nucleotidyltransferase [uncultured Ferrovibrio sp.]|jgi:poly(A) polymerase|uniref:CCA tRNA nucleotidyltransferase n=1 Tax=uncultured Ferrovibrio sp. TaxID=1576913 RepID=UPI00261D05BD|nr:CCA tRNA nucleotidyltransferase [uncultured Ferrovibrio sp.]